MVVVRLARIQAVFVGEGWSARIAAVVERGGGGVGYAKDFASMALLYRVFNSSDLHV